METCKYKKCFQNQKKLKTYLKKKKQKQNKNKTICQNWKRLPKVTQPMGQTIKHEQVKPIASINNAFL